MILESTKRIIERNPELSPVHQTLFRFLYNAGDGGLTYEDISNQMGKTVEELTGIFGALAKRINNTAGVDGNDGVYLMFEGNRDSMDWGWCMRPELREVIQESDYPWAKDGK